VLDETNTQKAKGQRLRAAKMKALAKKLPDRNDRRALLGLAASFLQQADELDRAPKLSGIWERTRDSHL